MSPLLFPALAGGPGSALDADGSALAGAALSAAISGHVERLLGVGARAGERVAVWTQPGLPTLVALLAQAHAGFVTVPLDPKLGPLELGHVAKDARVRFAVAADPAAVEGRLPGVATVPATLAPGTSEVEPRAADAAPLLVLYTSGTTGLPKGAVLSAGNVAANLDALARAWSWTAADTVVHALPLFHVHGLVLGLFGSARRGGALRWRSRFTPDGLAQALSPGQTVLFAVPTMYHRLVEAAAASPAIASALQAPRLLVSGSAALPLKDHAAVRALTGRTVVERYGLTETLINCAVRAGAEDEAGRVGPPLDGVELRLVDDARRPLDAHDDATLGEIAVRGPHVFLGYLDRPDATAAVRDADGWFYTGDLATRRADGSLRIVGRRATDLIKCGGYKVGAGEVEAALLEHPAVGEAAVLGVPDADLGEAIVAFVVAVAPVDAKTLEQFVAASLSPHKRPRQVHLVDALPRNAMGKVQKKVLRERLATPPP